jgi:hypothetical protein
MNPARGAALVGLRKFFSLRGFGSSRFGLLASGAAQALAGELDAMRVVDEAIQDGVGVSRIPDQHTMPPLLMVWSLKCALFLAAMGCLARCCPSSA